MLLETFPKEHKDLYNEMENTYRYLKTEPVMLNQLNKECQGNEDLEQLFNEVLNLSQRYVEDVCEMIELSEENDSSRESAELYAQKDQARTTLHDSLISSINPLYRLLKNSGKDTAILDPYVKDNNRIQYRNLALELVYNLILSKVKKDE